MKHFGSLQNAARAMSQKVKAVFHHPERVIGPSFHQLSKSGNHWINYYEHGTRIRDAFSIVCKVVHFAFSFELPFYLVMDIVDRRKRLFLFSQEMVAVYLIYKHLILLLAFFLSRKTVEFCTFDSFCCRTTVVAGLLAGALVHAILMIAQSLGSLFGRSFAVRFFARQFLGRSMVDRLIVRSLSE